ncbi:MAG: efflux RND transporter periplasmic adaptor subunit [Sphingobacterium sp.]|uniref:efflux RND transporter periplasmic adaptor subunit n=1 Tax=Sphingobacterium sp. JB170 TaxID=1434842 RepID=UPI000B35C07C|nr:efflux RND transporter periplasmic adaptor subunit [Sphingobacterium sp. JB170]
MQSFRISQPLFNTVKLTNIIKYILLSSPLLFYACTSSTGKEAVTAPIGLPVMAVQTDDQTILQKYPASIEASANIEIRAQVAGILERIYIDEGSKVKAGQLLFKINDHPYQEQLNQAKANLSSAQADLQNAELEVEKKTRLVDNKIVTEYQLKAAFAARDAAKARVGQAESAVESAKINVNYTSIRATSDGYIGRLEKKQGSLITMADPQPLTVLSDVGKLHVYFSLGENDFIAFKNATPGNTLQEKLKNLPPVSLLLSDENVYEHQGQIDMVDGQFDKNTAAITLRATFDNPQGILRSGNTGRIVLQKEYSEAVLIPQLATREVQDKVFVFTVGPDNKVTQQSVEILAKSGENYLVESGIRAGDRIVYKGIDLLQDGQQITPQPLAKDSIH